MKLMTKEEAEKLVSEYFHKDWKASYIGACLATGSHIDLPVGKLVRVEDDLYRLIAPEEVCMCGCPSSQHKEGVKECESITHVGSTKYKCGCTYFCTG